MRMTSFKSCGFLLTLLVLSFLGSVHGDAQGGMDELYNRIYYDTDGTPCTRLLHREGIIGCNAGSGVRAPLRHLLSNEDITSFTSNPPDDGHAVLLSQSLFTKSNVEALEATGRLSGILLEHAAPADGFSPANPSGQIGDGRTWNPQGESLLYRQFEYPVFALDEDETAEAARWAAKLELDGSYPRPAVEFEADMFAKFNSSHCLKQGNCAPVGGWSLWGGLQSFDDTKKIVLASAQLDTNSIFRDLAQGSVADISGVATLVGAITALRNVSTSDLEHQILFAFFNAEVWERSGSRRFVDDIVSGNATDQRAVEKCIFSPEIISSQYTKIKLENITSMLEVSQLGASATETIYAHSQNTPTSALNILGSVATSEGIDYQQSSVGDLPPSSTQSFSAVPGVVLTGYDATFTNKYYHSLDDNEANATALCGASNLLAKSLFRLAGGTVEASSAIDVDCTVVSDILECMTFNRSCNLRREHLPYIFQRSNYASVFQLSQLLFWNGRLEPRSFLYAYLFDQLPFETGPNCTALADCEQHFNGTDYQYKCWDGKCIASELYYHPALSPSIQCNTDTSRWEVVGDSDGAWVESDWAAALGLRFYLLDSSLSEGLVLMQGFVSLIVSFLGVYGVKEVAARQLKLQ